MDSTRMENFFDVGYEVYHEEFGMFGEVIATDETSTFVEFEDGSRTWVEDLDLMYRDTAEHMLGLCGCEWDDDENLIDELGLESGCDY